MFIRSIIKTKQTLKAVLSTVLNEDMAS